MTRLQARSSAVIAASVAFAAVLVAAALPLTVSACSCRWRPLSDLADEVDVAFAGRKVHSTTNGEVAIFTLQVDRVYKGEAGPRTVVHSHVSGATCGRDFGAGGPQAVLAYAEETRGWLGLEAGELTSGYCSTHITIADLIEVFGDGYPPDETILLPTVPKDRESENRASSGIALVIGGMIVVGVVAMVWWVRRSRNPGPTGTD